MAFADQSWPNGECRVLETFANPRQHDRDNSHDRGIRSDSIMDDCWNPNTRFSGSSTTRQHCVTKSSASTCSIQDSQCKPPPQHRHKASTQVCRETFAFEPPVCHENRIETTSKAASDESATARARTNRPVNRYPAHQFPTCQPPYETPSSQPESKSQPDNRQRRLHGVRC